MGPATRTIVIKPGRYVPDTVAAGVSE